MRHLRRHRDAALIADLHNAWRYDRRQSIRFAFRDGQIAAALGGDRTDCPHLGNVAPTRKNKPRSAGSAKQRSDKRRAWLAGFDGQKEAMNGKDHADADRG